MSKIARHSVLLLAGGAALLMVGCATTYTIRPVQEGPVGVAAAADLQLYADAAAWSWYPADLPEYMTPVAVRIINNTDKEISLTYGSFSLVDNRGFRYAAIDPFTGESGEPRPEEQVGSKEQEGRPPVLLAALGSAAMAGALPRASSQAAPAATVGDSARGAVQEQLVAARRVRRFSVRRGHRFHVYPRYRTHFRYYSPWRGAVYYPPAYGVYVHGWGPSYPPSPQIKERALPEGVIQPGGEVSGFLYFQNASQRADRLQLIWDATTPDGQPIARLDIGFVVVPS